MEVFDQAFIDLWRALNFHCVKYILVGGFATNLHGYQRFTGDLDLYIEDTLENRRKFRAAYADYGMGDFEAFETIQFIPGWVDFPLQNGIRMDIQTSLKGVAESFDECYSLANKITIQDVTVPVLHLNHLIANKKAVKRPKDLSDVIELEKIRAFKEENQ